MSALYPRKRTLISAVVMSALCQKQTFCAGAERLAPPIAESKREPRQSPGRGIIASYKRKITAFGNVDLMQAFAGSFAKSVRLVAKETFEVQHDPLHVLGIGGKGM